MMPLRFVGSLARPSWLRLRRTKFKGDKLSVKFRSFTIGIQCGAIGFIKFKTGIADDHGLWEG